MTMLLKFIATTKSNNNFQKTDPAGHSLLVKWNKYQKCYKNRIQHFLPRVGEHPEITLQVVVKWDTALKDQKKEEVLIPVDFPAEFVRMYKELNDAYVAQTPVKAEEAALIRKIMAMDMRYLYGSGLEWNKEPEPQPVRRSNVAPAADSLDQDRSPSPPADDDPLDFTKWDVNDLASIQWDKIVLSPDISFTSNRLYHAVAILFFLHPELPQQHAQLADALHAGWSAVFKHPMMNFDELRRPPCVGEGAYSKEELDWCTATTSFLVDTLDPPGRLARGIPDSALSRRMSGRNRAGPAAPAAGGAGPAGGGAGVGGGARAGASAGKERRGDDGCAGAGRRGRGGGTGARPGAETIEMDESQDPDADTEDESPVATIDKAGKRSKGKSRYPHF